MCWRTKEKKRFLELQKEIEFLYKEKNEKVLAEEGQGRGKVLSLVQGKQKKIAEKYDRDIAPKELEKKHIHERLVQKDVRISIGISLFALLVSIGVPIIQAICE